MQKESLNQYRVVIPWLSGVPDEIYYQLDTTEFYMPEGQVIIARQELEDSLKHFVMTYNREVFNTDIPLAAHLCANLEGAQLDMIQLSLLQQYESRFKEQGVSFVAYKRPLTVIQPTQSWIYQVYQAEGLLL